MTPHQDVILVANSRKEMEEWLTAIKQSVQKANNAVSGYNLKHTHTHTYHTQHALYVATCTCTCTCIVAVAD